MCFKGLRIVFYGTPDFAVASLESLLNAGANIVGVVTAPDKPAGRGLKNVGSPVKKYAQEKHLFILQPEKLRDTAFLQALQDLEADIQIVVAFRMLPEMVWNMPPLGTINLHASLLPQYRGAAPINWAIINGESETGVTTFKLQQEIDTGNILLQKKVPIFPQDNAGSLYDRLKLEGADLLVQTLQAISRGELNETVQPVAEDLKKAPKITRDTCLINFQNRAVSIHNQVRGLAPFPGAFTYLQGKILKVFVVQPELSVHHHDAGSFHTDEKSYLKISCIDGYVNILELQLEGKKRMKIVDFLKGQRFN